MTEQLDHARAVKRETIEDAVKSGDTARVLAAIARFERRGRMMDFVELAVIWGVIVAGIVLFQLWLAR